jgi:ATP-dependent helicase/nuclease subunit B
MILNQTLDQVKACNSRIYNIAANYHFLESLADFLLNKFSIEKIAKLKILLPNRRLARSFQLILSKKITNNDSTFKLPKIKAISDINLDDFIDNFANHQDLNLIHEIEEITNQLTKIKIESEIENLLFLSKKIKDWQEITKFFGGNFSNSEALNIASNLLELFNESQKEAIDLGDLLNIDDSEDSLHRQFILQFLQQFYFEIKNSLLKNNLTSKTLYQNLITDQFSDFIQKFGHSDPIIIAGSTGSIKSTKKLIKTILELENGQVIIYGFDRDFRKNATGLNQESHPQFMINSLIDYLKINYTDIVEIQNDQYLLSSKTKKRFIEMAMLPSDEIIKWQDFSSQIDDLDQLALSLKKISLINARNEIEESKIIAIALKEAEIAGKKAALITNDQNLIYMVKLELQKFKIQFNDATNIGIFHSKLINFILLILELINDYDSNKFLTLLKHDLCFFSAKEFDQELSLFELEIIRKAKISNDFKGIKIAIDNLEDQNLSMNLANNFGIIFNIFSKLESLLKTSPSLSNFTKQLIIAIENLSRKNFVEILDQEDANQEISDCFKNLINPDSRANLITTDRQDILQLFKILFAKVSYFEKSSLAQPNCLIQILPTIEARQLNHDLTIISSLNEGSFPEISSENWLGKKIKKDLKIDKSSKQIGINAYDFCNHFCNPKVILTRSISSNNSPTTPSRFILKLQSLAKKINLDFDDGAVYLQAFNQMNKAQFQDSNVAISRPNPKPAIEYRPINYAITDISKLICDPYSIYAKKILKLRPLNKIDYEGANAEFGSFIHEVLEKFIKQPDREISDFVKKAKKIFLKYFPNQELELIWWPKFENIFSAFLDHELELINTSNHVEIPVKLILDISYKQIIINGKIDRLIFDQNNLATIIDYKTGSCPTRREVTSGLEPQLTISALALIEGQNLSLPKLSLEKIDNLEYWKLSFGKENEYNKIFKDHESLQQTTKATKIMLQDLFNYFFNQQNLNGYISCYDQELYQENEYKYLARIDEWNL